MQFQITLSWVVTSCSLRRYVTTFRRPCDFHHQGVWLHKVTSQKSKPHVSITSLSIKMETGGFSETSIDIYQITRSNVPENRSLNINCSKKIRSRRFMLVLIAIIKYKENFILVKCITLPFFIRFHHVCLYVRFEIFTSVSVKNAVFWDVALCRSYVKWRSSETSVHTRCTRRRIPEDGILHICL
jgi:hypothetical protein